MLKVIATFKRRPGMSVEAFRDYWLNRHAPLGRSIIPANAFPALYVQNHVEPMEGKEPPFDALAELGFSDEAGLERWNKWYFSEAGRPLREDEPNFMDLASRRIVLTRAHFPKG